MSDVAKEYLDERVIYAFIRQDVEVKHQLVQFGHAMRQATTDYTMANVIVEAAQVEQRAESVSTLLKTPIVEPPFAQGIPFLTCVGMPDTKGLERVIAKLKAKHIAHTAFHDTDYEFGVVSVVTEPLPLSVREKPDGLMCNYRLWNPANNRADGDFYVAYLLGVLDVKTGRPTQTREDVARELFPIEQSLRGMGGWGPDELPICPDCRTIMPKASLDDLSLHAPKCQRRSQVGGQS